MKGHTLFQVSAGKMTMSNQMSEMMGKMSGMMKDMPKGNMKTMSGVMKDLSQQMMKMSTAMGGGKISGKEMKTSAVFWYGGWPFLKGFFEELKSRRWEEGRQFCVLWRIDVR